MGFAGISGMYLETPLHTLQALKLRETGNYSAAVAEFIKGDADNLSSELSQTYFLLGDNQFHTGDFDQAIISYSFILKPELQPNTYTGQTKGRLRQVYAAKGKALEEAKQYTLAVDSYKQATLFSDEGKTEKDPSDAFFDEAQARVWLAQADEFKEAKNFKDALATYQKVAGFPSKTESVITARARIESTLFEWGFDLETNEKNYTEALSLYDQAITDGYNSQAVEKARNQARGVVFKLGDAAIVSGQFEEAIAYYEKSVSQYGGQEEGLKPYFSKTYLAWGQKLLAGGNFEAALARLEPSMKELGTSTTLPYYRNAIIKAYKGIGTQLFNSQKYSEIVTRFDSAFKTYGSYDTENYLSNLLTDALNSLGADYEIEENYEQAALNYATVLQYAPSDSTVASNARISLANIFAKQARLLEGNESKQALVVSFYEDAVQQAEKSGNVELYTDLKGRLEAAQSVKNLQGTITLNLAKGETLENNFEYPAAITSYETALTAANSLNKEPVKVDLRNRLANLYIKVGQNFESVGSYEDALDNYDRAADFADANNNSALLETIDSYLANVQLLEFDKIDQDEANANNDILQNQDELNSLLIDSGLLGCSFIPLVGWGCDLTLLGKSLSEGDWVGVGLSAIGFVPLVGDLLGDGGKAAKVGERILSLQQKLIRLEKVLNDVRKVGSINKTHYLERAARISRSSKTIKAAEKPGAKYASLIDPPGVAAGKEFTAEQKRLIILENMKRNSGVVRSDLSGKVLVPSTQNIKGVVPSGDEWQIDHIIPRAKGGPNSYANAQVLSREENLAKSDN